MAGDSPSSTRSYVGAGKRGESRSDFPRKERGHPNIEYVLADRLSPGRWFGLTAMAEAVRSVLSGWEMVRLEAEDYRELDEKRVFVLSRAVGRFKASGLEPADLRPWAAHLFEVDHGQVRGLVYYFEREHAFAALSRAPESGAAGPD